MTDLLGYEGKRCVVVGAATGMGEACASALVGLGAEVIALDIAPITVPVKQAISVDLKDADSIAAAVEQIPGDVPALFNCAGIPGPPFSALDTMLVNFVGGRALIEALIPRIPKGGAIAMITSVAGVGYKQNLEKLKELIATEDFASGKAWCEANPDIANGYIGSKQALIVYTKMRAAELLKKEIRMNCLAPAPTETPMLPSFHDQVSKEFINEHFQAPVGRDATAAEMGDPLIFLNSTAARFISGQNLIVDYGYCGEVDVGLRPSLLGG